MRNAKTHFIALLTFEKTENSGKTTPVSSGYRPTVKFPFGENLFTANVQFEEPEHAFSGDIISANITLLNADDILSKIYEGLDFDFFEGQINVGHGTVIKISN